jgi:hypothetical protein
MDLRTGPSAAEGETRGLITLKGDPGKVFIDTLMTMIAYAFLQHRRLAQAGRKKRINGSPPQPSLPAVRQAIVDLILP